MQCFQRGEEEREGETARQTGKPLRDQEKETEGERPSSWQAHLLNLDGIKSQPKSPRAENG